MGCRNGAPNLGRHLLMYCFRASAHSFSVRREGISGIYLGGPPYTIPGP